MTDNTCCTQTRAAMQCAAAEVAVDVCSYCKEGSVLMICLEYSNSSSNNSERIQSSTGRAL